MPQKDDKGRYCGVVDIEEKEKSAKFVRRYLRLDEPGGVVEWFTDNPSTLPTTPQPQGTIDINFITKVDIPKKLKFKAKNCFFIHTPPRRYYFQGIDDNDMREWVDILDNASKISISSDEDAAVLESGNRGNDTNRKSSAVEEYGYTTKIVAGVVIQKKLVSEDHSNITKNDDSTSVKSLTLPQGSHLKTAPRTPGTVLKQGWGVKQGHVRKNWKRRFFVVTSHGFSYYKSDLDKDPIRTVPVSTILTAKKDTSMLADYRDNLFMVATTERKYYIQADSQEEMEDWIKSFDRALQFSNTTKRRSKDGPSGKPTDQNAAAGQGSAPPLRSKLDVSLSLIPASYRSSAYLGATSPTIATNRLSCADEALYSTQAAKSTKKKYARQSRVGSSSEDSLGMGGSVDSLSGPAIESKPLISKRPNRRRSKDSPKRAFQRSASGTEILSPASGGAVSTAAEKQPGQNKSQASSNASTPRSSGSFSSVPSRRASRVLQLDPKVDRRAAVKPSTVKKKKNTGILFSLNNIMNKRAAKIGADGKKQGERS